MGDGTVTLFLCGDVMLGRGVDQILASPGDPALREDYGGDARSYVRLAESAGGPIPAPVAPSWPWGEALRFLEETAPDARVLNLETSVTRSDAFAPGKAVHYRMHPDNLPALTVARPDVCVLANNHVLDFGRSGLTETLDSLDRAGLRTAGAGRDAAQAYAPAAVPLRDGRRLLVFALGAGSSGIPADWAAAEHRSGVAYVPELSASSAAEAVAAVRRARGAGDLVVVSVHWGSNWGYLVPRSQVRFAHALVDGGVDVVHGHSCHHPRAVEVYRDRPILYGCGDFIDDYEGISGYEEYRDDLRLAHLVTLAADTGRLVGLRMVPFQVRRLRLEPASAEDRGWLRHTLDRISHGVRVTVESDGVLRCVAGELQGWKGVAMPQRRVVTGRSQEPRQRFAEELRELRAQKGVSLRQLGERLGWDCSLFGKMEKGETLGGPEVVQALDDYYGTPGLLLALWELARADKTQFREQYREYMALEDMAVGLCHFAVSVLPGLLQTPGYARELLAVGGLKGEELEQQVEARMGRRELLEGEGAPSFRTILSEAVLQTPLRAAGEWGAQLEHLLDIAERENVTVHVLPNSAGLHALMGFDLWYLLLPDGRTVAYTENGYRGELIEESTSVVRLQKAYDSVRDLALSPVESRKHILRKLEEVPCESST